MNEQAPVWMIEHQGDDGNSYPSFLLETKRVDGGYWLEVIGLHVMADATKFDNEIKLVGMGFANEEELKAYLNFEDRTGARSLAKQVGYVSGAKLYVTSEMTVLDPKKGLPVKIGSKDIAQ